MSMNKSKGNMYPWITHTWNPLGGECSHKCRYCSTYKLKKRFPIINDKYSGEIRLEEEFETNLGKDNFIFVCAQHDLFACDVPQEFVMKILDHCSKYDNTYLFQSKNPAGFIEFAVSMPEKVVFCTTIETNRWYEDIMGQSPMPYNRAKAMLELSETEKTYVTIEPVMDFDLEKMVQLIMACGPAQINIGADSGNNKLPEPSTEKLRQLIMELGMNNGRKVVAKDNLKRLL